LGEPDFAICLTLQKNLKSLEILNILDPAKTITMIDWFWEEVLCTSSEFSLFEDNSDNLLTNCQL